MNFFIGRFTLGSHVPLRLQCVNSSGVPTDPAEAPIATIHSATAKVATLRTPISDKFQTTGLFVRKLFLDSQYAAGDYVVAFSYKIGSDYYGEVQTYSVVAGGHADGSGIAAAYFPSSGTDHLLTHQDSGRILRRRNPRLA